MNGTTFSGYARISCAMHGTPCEVLIPEPVYETDI